MKALILNGELKKSGSMENISNRVEDILIRDGYEVENILLNEKDIKPCNGCFGCWVKTPGICVIDDYGRIVSEKVINSDIVIYLTPVVYGGYSSELKKALDRIIPLLLPFFKKIKGEIHHKKRYKKYPEVIVLGSMSKDDKTMEEIFNSIIKRNSLNWYNSFSGGIIKNNSEDEIRKYLSNKIVNKKGEVC